MPFFHILSGSLHAINVDVWCLLDPISPPASACFALSMRGCFLGNSRSFRNPSQAWHLKKLWNSFSPLEHPLDLSYGSDFGHSTAVQYTCARCLPEAYRHHRKDQHVCLGKNGSQDDQLLHDVWMDEALEEVLVWRESLSPTQGFSDAHNGWDEKTKKIEEAIVPEILLVKEQ